MTGIDWEAKNFRQQRANEQAHARQNAAFFLMSGIDLATALNHRGDERKATILRLGRLLERERLKGVRQHWSYDLNRHIALKQAYDRLLSRDEGKDAASA
jgi:hypothetical protein